MAPNMSQLYVKRGDDVTLTCVVVDANPVVTSYVWTNRSETTDIITISDIQLSDAGHYTCKGVNGVSGAVVITKTITVQGKLLNVVYTFKCNRSFTI